MILDLFARFFQNMHDSIFIFTLTNLLAHSKFCIHIGRWKMNGYSNRYFIGGILALIIAMGIGRFAYTVILPYMQEEFAFSNATAGFLAASNYFGYFLGALLASKITLQNRKVSLLRLWLVISIVTTAMIGIFPSYPIWYVTRFTSGVASAYIFVVASSIVLDRLAHENKSHLSGLFYSGVGLGIMLSSLVVSKLNQWFQWDGTWIGLALLCSGLFVFIWFFVREEVQPQLSSKHLVLKHDIPTPPKNLILLLIIAYGLEGLGYIVTGTFIVSIAENSTYFHGSATTVWLIVGIAASPSCIIWSYLGKKYGFVKSIIFAMLLQAIGIVLPVFEENTSLLFASALLFGATFMGITTLATTLARQLAPSNSNRVLGFLTASYAFGQLLGPALAGILATLTNSFHYALLCAAFVVLIGSALLSRINGL